MRFVVSGNSMSPRFGDGDKLFVCRFIYKIVSPKIGDAVVLTDPRSERLILKKIDGIHDGKYFVTGENPTESTDSRIFGAIGKDRIVGKVLFRYKKTLTAKISNPTDRSE